MFHPPSVNGFRRVEHCMRCGSVNSPLLHGYTSGNYPPNKHLYDIRTRRRRATQPPAFSSRPINLNLSCQLQSPTLAIILPLVRRLNENFSKDGVQLVREQKGKCNKTRQPWTSRILRINRAIRLGAFLIWR
uniref:Uncharacterized protein n=1 Tax=Schistocephalus solidus TaxID=70667 RepID=A0A0X3P5P6_SCHSO